jgi:hypothetical protein
MLTIWRHYAGTQGNYESFELSPEALSDVSSTDYVPGVYRWIYAGPGVVEDLPCGGHNISLTLETVPPVAASVVGTRLRIALMLATGGAVSTDTSGITGVIELGLMTGDAFEAQNGLSESIELSLTTGEAFGGIAGLHESIELVLDAGAAIGDVQVGGVAEAIELALTTGPGSVASALGIDEAIDLVLVGGAAEEVVPSAPADPDFASVSLLLHMDGANGGTTFTDSSSFARTVFISGNVQTSTAQSKFGGASALFDGSGDFLSFVAASELEFTGDFTIECFAYPTVTTDKIIAGDGSAGGDAQNVQLFRINSSVVGNLAFFLNGTQVFANTAAGITANEWQHLAIARSGSTTRMFVNGTQIGSSNTSWTGSFKFSRIGGEFNLDYQGYIDEFRITKGVARYTANFTPPTAPFPDS